MARKKATAEAVVMEPVVEEVKVDETVNAAAEPEKKEEVKKPRTRKAAAPKTEENAEKKAPAKRAAKKTVKAEEPAAQKAEEAPAEKKAPARKAAKKPAEVKAAVSVQFAGKEYTTEQLVEIAKAVWQYDLNQKPEDFQSVELYVKTEESQVYYVINGSTTGSFGI